MLMIFPISAQQEVDSLRLIVDRSEGALKVDALNTLASRLLTINPLEAQAILDESLDEAERLNYDQGTIEALLQNATLLSQKRKYDQAEKFILRTRELAQAINDLDGLASSYLVEGNNLVRKGDYDESIDRFIRGLKITEELDDQTLRASFLLNIGRQKEILGELSSASEYLQEALAIYQREGQEYKVGQSYINLGVLEYKRQNVGLSIEYNENALTIFRKLEDKALIALSLQNLGFAYAHLEQYAKAFEYYDESFTLRREINDLYGIGKIYLNKAKIFEAQNQVEKAREAANTSLEFADSIKNKLLKRDIYSFLYSSYRKRKSFETALTYYEKLEQVKDSMAIEANQNRIAELTAAYEFDQIINENKLKEQESQLKDNQIRQRNTLITGLFILLIMLIILIYLQREKMRSKLALTQKDHLLTLKEKQLANEQLKSKDDQLQTYVQELSQKDSILEKTQSELDQIKTNRDKANQDYAEMIEKLNESILNNDWAKFKLYFEKAYPDFFKKLNSRISSMTQNDQRLAALIKMNLTNKEIAKVFHISPDSVVRAKHRLRQKMSFDSPREVEEYMRTL